MAKKTAGIALLQQSYTSCEVNVNLNKSVQYQLDYFCALYGQEAPINYQLMHSSLDVNNNY